MINLPKIKSKSLKWGVAGCGRFTETRFLPAINLMRKSVVNAVFSNDGTRAKAVADKFGIREVIPIMMSSLNQILMQYMSAVLM
jgi:predicted dehydrogenase